GRGGGAAPQDAGGACGDDRRHEPAGPATAGGPSSPAASGLGRGSGGRGGGEEDGPWSRRTCSEVGSGRRGFQPRSRGFPAQRVLGPPLQGGWGGRRENGSDPR